MCAVAAAGARHGARGAGLGARGAGPGSGPRAGGGMEELSSVGEQVFAAECILSKRLRKVRAPPSPVAAARQPVAHPGSFLRRASLSTWSSGAAGPPSESAACGRPSRARHLSGDRVGLGTLGPACDWGSGAFAGRAGSSRDPRAFRRPGLGCPLFTSPRGAGLGSSRPGAPTRRAPPRPFVACVPRGSPHPARGPLPCPGFLAVT